VSGNPGGRPAHDRGLRALAVADRQKNFNYIRKLRDDPKAPRELRFEAAKLLAQYSDGKPSAPGQPLVNIDLRSGVHTDAAGGPDFSAMDPSQMLDWLAGHPEAPAEAYGHVQQMSEARAAERTTAIEGEMVEPVVQREVPVPAAPAPPAAAPEPEPDDNIEDFKRIGAAPEPEPPEEEEPEPEVTYMTVEEAAAKLRKGSK
jgi:hypothetical protein